MQSRLGRLHRAYESGGNIFHLASPLPWPPFADPVTVTAGTQPCLFEASVPFFGLHLLYRTAGNVYERESHDNGKTWSDPALMFTGGSRPSAAVGADGSVLRIANVGGVVKGTLQLPGHPVIGQVVTFQIVDPEDEFGYLDLPAWWYRVGLAREHAGMARWWMSGWQSGYDWSCDWGSSDGQTWAWGTISPQTFYAPTHVATAVRRDGTVLRVAQRQAPFPMAMIGTLEPLGWQAGGHIFTLQDDLGVNLVPTDWPNGVAFGLSCEETGMGRWWLSVHLSGEGAVSDWFSHDGKTWTRAA